MCLFDFSTTFFFNFQFSEVDQELQDRSLLEHVWESKGTRFQGTCKKLTVLEYIITKIPLWNYNIENVEN